MAGLRLQTPALELRWPSLDDLGALAELAALGVHDPEVQPFMVAWTDASPDERALSTMQYHWSRWASWQPSDWTLELVVVRDGTVVGTQGVGGRDFAVLREVHCRPGTRPPGMPGRVPSDSIMCLNTVVALERSGCHQPGH